MIQVDEDTGKDVSLKEDDLLLKVKSLMAKQFDPTGKSALVKRSELPRKSELERQNEGKYADEFQVQNFETGPDEGDKLSD